MNGKSCIQGSIEFITRYVDKSSGAFANSFSYTGEYYNDSYQAAKCYSQGAINNHYYPLKEIRLSESGKKLVSIPIKCVSTVNQL